MNDECVPATMKRAVGGKQIGDWCGAGAGKIQARKELIRRDGPPPFPSAICRHECDNDSMATAGFVCTLHTTWGTYSENEMDKDPEDRARGGRISGRIAVESGQFGEAGRLGSKSPNNPNNLQVTCPHCGKTGAKRAMARWHFDNCKTRNQE